MFQSIQINFLGVANFNSKNGCIKCTTLGEYSYISHTVYFPKTGCDLRTDEGFRSKLYGSHHKTHSPLEDLPIDMVEDFPVGDSLHLIDLGVMKRCLTGWRDGHFGTYLTKWAARDTTLVSKFLVSCKMPSEIHRTVRGLDVLAYWKASEYRTFLHYLSIIVLKKVLPSDVYEHFVLFFCSITICSSEFYTHLLPLSQTLLENYVELYRDFYGEDYMTSNIHNLSHLVDEVKKFGILSTFNAYPFENRLYCIKNLLRSGNLPLSQVAKRIQERLKMENSETLLIQAQFPSLKNFDQNENATFIQFKNFCLNSKKNKDKWFITLKNEIVSLSHITKTNNQDINIYGHAVKQINDYFYIPVKSSYLNIYSSNGVLRSTVDKYTIKDIKCKMVSVTDGNETIFLPFLHTYTI